MSAEQTTARLEEAVGEWWSSSDPATRRPGMLRRLSDEGMWEVVLFRGLIGDDDFNETLTIHGDTSAGRVTVRSASRWEWGTTIGGGPETPELFSRENWRAFSIIHGGHYEDDQLWQSLSFDLPYAWDWFSPVQLERNTEFDPLSDNYSEILSCTLDDQQIELWRSIVKTHGRKKRAVEGTSGYRLISSQGFTLAQAERPVLAIEALHHVLFGKRMTTDAKALTAIGDDSHLASALLVYGSRSSPPPLRLKVPYFGTGEIDFESFVPSWIRLHVQAQIWPSIAPQTETAGWLETQVIEAVNAAEALARHLRLESSDPNDKEAAILKAIEDLPTDTKKYAAKALEIKRDTLAARLRLLAQYIGPHSATWLLGEDVHAWSSICAEARNALSHGYPTRQKLERDPRLLFEVISSVRLVQKLAMLRAAGFTNGQVDSIELLADSSEQHVIRHVNAPLAEDALQLHDRNAQWATWRRRGRS
jgi:hypothetical protein